MNEEEKAIEFLKNKTTNYSLSGEELHYYLILYYLIINLQKENQKLKEKLEASEKARKEAIEFIKPLKTEKPYGIITNEFKKRMLYILNTYKGE